MLHCKLVYQFQFNIFSDMYYGMTKRHFTVRACEHLSITPLTGKKVKSPKVQYSIIFSMRVMTHVLIILKPLSKSLMDLDSSESRFWYCVIIHLWIDMLSQCPWDFIDNYLQFSFIISIIVTACSSYHVRVLEWIHSL